MINFLVFRGTLTTRIVWTLLVEVVVFVTTIVLAMVDTSQWAGLFFYLTVGCVAVLNSKFGSAAMQCSTVRLAVLL